MNRTLHTVFNVLIALALLISFSVQPAIGARMETESIPPATPEEISENNPIYLPVLAVEAMQIYQITGRVTDGNDNPVSGVTISSDAGHTAVTDGEGKYVLSGFSEGLYALNVQSDSVYCSPLNMLVNVPPNTPQKNFTCSSDLYPVAGTILDKEGNPVEGATVSDSAGRATLTDASGNYQMELPAGIYTLTPSAPDRIFDPASFTVRVGSFKARTPANAVQFTALSSTWTPMNLAAPLAGMPRLTDRNMKVDKSGRVHIVFDNGAASGTETLYYGLYDGTAWTFTQLDAAAGTGMYASIALDSKNLAHVAYYDSVNENLKYIRQMIMGDGTVVWAAPRDADNLGAVGKTPSIVTDSNNMPHIVYVDDDDNSLKYAYLLAYSGNFQIEEVDKQAGYQAQFPSIGLTSNETVYVSYYQWNTDTEDGVLKFAYRAGEDIWIKSTVATGLFALDTFQTLRQSPLQVLDITAILSGVGFFNSLIVDSENRAHIAYYNDFTDTLEYAVGGPGGFHFDIVDSFDSVGGFASIGIDALDRPQISYIRQSDLAGSSGGALKFAIRLDAGWRTEFVDMIGPVAAGSLTSTSIYVDTSDNTHILYYDFSTGNFKYAFTAKWEYQVVGLVGTLSEPGNRNLALDSFGLPHIAFGGTSLYHGYFDGSLWQFELVDASPTAGGYASIAMDEDDNIYISYYDALAGSGDLKFAFLDKAAGFWTIETVDSTGDVGKFTSLALDDSNRPHIAYFDEDLDDLMYATKSGSSWNIDTVDDSSGAGGYPSIAVNSNGEPRIAYTDFVDEQLMYAIYNDDEWLTPRNIGYDGQVRSFISLSIDSWDLPHITFFEDQGEDPDENDNLMYAYHNGYSWTIDLIDRNDSVGWYNSMRLDSYNDIHVSYYDDSNGNLKYAHGSLFDWNDIVVDYGVLGTDDVGLFSSLYLDKADRPLFLYYDATNNVLRFAQRNLWDKQTVALSPAASFQEPGRPNLAVDVARRPHVVFGDTAIHYWFNDGFLWLENSPVDVANAGGYASVAVDSRGLPYVVYYDLNTEELKYNRQDGLGWLAAPVVIDSDDDVGKYASIAIEEFGPDVTVHVAYFDETNDTLKYARFNQNGGAINIEVVDDSSLVGSYPSLVLDGSGRPSISYYNIKDNNLKYAVRLGSDSWSTGTVISSGKVGLFSSLDLDSAGLPHIAFFDDDTDDLIYTWFNGYYWSFEVVDTYDSTGWYGSLQLDSNDQPHISYYDHSSQNLKHAFVYAHDWVTEIVDMAGDVGRYTSLQIDQSDGVHIVYYDTTTGSVKYVRGVDW